MIEKIKKIGNHHLPISAHRYTMISFLPLSTFPPLSSTHTDYHPLIRPNMDKRLFHTRIRALNNLVPGAPPYPASRVPSCSPAAPPRPRGHRSLMDAPRRNLISVISSSSCSNNGLNAVGATALSPSLKALTNLVSINIRCKDGCLADFERNFNEEETMQLIFFKWPFKAILHTSNIINVCNTIIYIYIACSNDYSSIIYIINYICI
jgi:hypothetical protein